VRASPDAGYQIAEDRSRQHRPHVPALRAQPVAGAGDVGEHCLRSPFHDTAADEVAPGRALWRDVVANAGARLIDPILAGGQLRRAYAELRLLRGARNRLAPGNATEPRIERTGSREHRGAHGHVRADRVTNPVALPGHAGVGAPDDPVELRGEPARRRLLPERLDDPAGAEHVRVP